MEPTEIGYSHVSCAGNEERLEECTVGNFTSHNCSEVGIVFQCFNGILIIMSTYRWHIENTCLSLSSTVTGFKD